MELIAKTKNTLILLQRTIRRRRAFQMEFFAVGKGLSGALKLLKERGSLEVKHDTDAVRMTDELGRPMTQKEAYNRLSHAFHRKGPGKRKQEKCRKQFEKEQKLKQMSSSDTPLQSMETVREAQAQLRKPYLVLSGHVHPGQTSDPASGFATVEQFDLPRGLPLIPGERRRKSDPESSGKQKSVTLELQALLFLVLMNLVSPIRTVNKFNFRDLKKFRENFQVLLLIV
ncbi:LOW QUALITY PROTEIN: SART-1 family protein DOT2 [Malus sylvestris]|nr:LOW QUALITY PROTEIN: SART-1 family protein DOT2 [Malus sylvestris]